MKVKANRQIYGMENQQTDLWKWKSTDRSVKVKANQIDNLLFLFCQKNSRPQVQRVELVPRVYIESDVGQGQDEKALATISSPTPCRHPELERMFCSLHKRAKDCFFDIFDARFKPWLCLGLKIHENGDHKRLWQTKVLLRTICHRHRYLLQSITLAEKDLQAPLTWIFLPPFRPSLARERFLERWRKAKWLPAAGLPMRWSVASSKRPITFPPPRRSEPGSLDVLGRAGQALGVFLVIFSTIKNDFVAFFIKLTTYFCTIPD